ncbi:ADP-ribosylation factor-like protein 3 [Symsagittifera roscoffensis]|uniref:ADP-ribosylation factor-like protein 3 n=1 Tax=Symsagittifera roscoffensis TaxID=84072 RepID=UPI00307CA74A
MVLLSALRKLRKSSDRDLKLLLLGLDNAGKTTILKLVANEDPIVTPTQGVNVKSVQKDGFKMTIIDVGGQKNLRPFWRNYFDGTDVLVYVVDSHDTKRLQESADCFLDCLDESKLDKVPVLVLANKQDLKGGASVDQIKKSFDLADLTERQWTLLPSSAVGSGKGIQEGFEWAVKHAK